VHLVSLTVNFRWHETEGGDAWPCCADSDQCAVFSMQAYSGLSGTQATCGELLHRDSGTAAAVGRAVVASLHREEFSRSCTLVDR